jgi:hypothetical protein
MRQQAFSSVKRNADPNGSCSRGGWFYYYGAGPLSAR